MRVNLAHLPHDMALLHQLVRDLAARVEQRDGEIEKLRLIVRQLQRGQFGPRSERLDPDQLQLGLEDLDADIAHAETGQLPTAAADKTNREHRLRRLAFPEHLPREEVKLDLNTRACPVVVAPFIRSARRPVRCSIGYLPRCASSALVGPNTGAGPAVRSTRSLRPSASSPRAWRRPASLHRSWSANTAITCRSIVRPGSSLATASSSTARHWRTGSGRLLVVGAVACPARGNRLRRRQALRRRYADRGARPRPWSDQDRPVVGLYARRSAVGRSRAAGGCLLLQP